MLKQDPFYLLLIRLCFSLKPASVRQFEFQSILLIIHVISYYI